MYECALQLIACASKQPNNIREMKNFNMQKEAKQIYILLTHFLMEKGYISTLEILKNIFLFDKANALEVI